MVLLKGLAMVMVVCNVHWRSSPWWEKDLDISQKQDCSSGGVPADWLGFLEEGVCEVPASWQSRLPERSWHSMMWMAASEEVAVAAACDCQP